MTRKLLLSKGVRILLIGLLLGAASVSDVFAQHTPHAEDQSCFEAGGLYYRKLGNGKVAVTYPGYVNESTTNGQLIGIWPWGGCCANHPTTYTKPTGALIIPDSVADPNSNPNNPTKYAVTQIDGYAFYECTGLTSLSIPNNNKVKKIGDHAFHGCYRIVGVLDQIVPTSVKDIGAYAFYECAKFTGAPYIPDTSSFTILPGYVYSGCTGLNGTLVIPNNVTEFKDGVFENCINLGFPNNTLEIKNNITSIGGKSFKKCSMLTTLTFEAGGTENLIIKYSAFEECENLTGTLNIPPRVTRLGNGAFRKDKNIQYVYFGGQSSSLAVIENNVFAECRGLQNNPLELPPSLTFIGNQAFQFCTNLKGDLIIPAGVTEIGKYAFDNDKGLDGVLVLPDGLTTIGERAFGYCEKLHGDLNIPESVTTLGVSAFTQCRGFDGVLNFTPNNNPPQIREIPKTAFFQCTKLIGKIEIPESVTTIGEQAFYQNYGITEDIIVGSQVTSIGKEAFFGCSGVKGNIILKGQNLNIGARAFDAVNTFSALYCYSFEPPVMDTAAFNKNIGSAKVYVPFCSLEAYQNQPVDENTTWDKWTNATTDPETNQVIPAHPDTENGKPWNWSRFAGKYHASLPCQTTYNDGWKTYTNGAWQNSGTTPASTTKVTVESDFTLDENLEVAAMGIVEGNTLTIDGGSLTVTDTLVTFEDEYPYTLHAWHTIGGSTSKQDQALVKIMDDGQLYNSSPNVNGEYDKTIATKLAGGANNYATAGWYTVASPMASVTPSADNGFLVEGQNNTGYNLYYYDESASYSEWRNYKAQSFGITNGKGYLYGNSAAATVLKMEGNLHQSSETVTIPLSYASEIEGTSNQGISPKGFNLVGNPFPHQMELSDVKIGTEENNAVAITGYYVADGGGNLEASTYPIETGQGFFVQIPATLLETLSEGDDVYAFMSTSTPTIGSKGGRSVDNSYVRIEVSQDERLVDRAYVKLNEGGEGLSKFGLDLQHSGLCIPQGNKSFAIVVKAEEQNVMPLNYSTQANGTYTLTVALENADLDYLHLIDHMTGADVDLLLNPTYTFDSRTSDFASRFKLVFDGDVEEQEDESFAYFFDGNLVINSVNGEQMLRIFDMSGRVVLSECVSGSYNRQLNLTPGVYVVNLNGRNQKIVVR